MKKELEINEINDVYGSRKELQCGRLCKYNRYKKSNDNGITMIALIVSIGLIIVFVGTVIACIKANWHEQRALDGAMDTIDNYIDSTIEYNPNDIENSNNSIEE